MKHTDVKLLGGLDLIGEVILEKYISDAREKESLKRILKMAYGRIDSMREAIRLTWWPIGEAITYYLNQNYINAEYNPRLLVAHRDNDGVFQHFYVVRYEVDYYFNYELREITTGKTLAEKISHLGKGPTHFIPLDLITNAPVAQSDKEHQPSKLDVSGSNPDGRANKGGVSDG